MNEVLLVLQVLLEVVHVVEVQLPVVQVVWLNVPHQHQLPNRPKI